MSELAIAVVCASNQNRSMAAHELLNRKGFNTIKSYGTNTHIKLPGKSINTPHVYPFGTSYQHMHDELQAADKRFYTEKGLLQMLQRNSAIKKGPERFQDEQSEFDIIVTFEERVFDIVVHELNKRNDGDGDKPVNVLNVETPDNHSDAAIGAKHCHTLLELIMHCDDEWRDNIDDLVEEFEQNNELPILHTLCFY